MDERKEKSNQYGKCEMLEAKDQGLVRNSLLPKAFSFVITHAGILASSKSRLSRV